MPQRVFVDANVLASKTCRDWLFFLRDANEGMFQLHATHDVFAEALRKMRTNNPRLPGAVVAAMVKQIELCIDEVVPNFSGDLDFSGTDEGDYHVHAAATASRADKILTSNKPSDITQRPDDEYYEIVTPDEFFTLVADSNPACIKPITREQLEYWCRRAERGESVTTQLDDALRAAQCPKFADRVREALQQLAYE
ncbi:PIN domain-containing protein [Brachybacterium paraconglomeratum]|uniref:PIN domain-containing protein n=1 Tax=Brachybacterium TaxID=43668 RepID=UPI003879A419